MIKIDINMENIYIYIYIKRKHKHTHRHNATWFVLVGRRGFWPRSPRAGERRQMLPAQRTSWRAGPKILRAEMCFDRCFVLLLLEIHNFMRSMGGWRIRVSLFWKSKRFGGSSLATAAGKRCRGLTKGRVRRWEFVLDKHYIRWKKGSQCVCHSIVAVCTGQQYVDKTFSSAQCAVVAAESVSTHYESHVSCKQ